MCIRFLDFQHDNIFLCDSADFHDVTPLPRQFDLSELSNLVCNCKEIMTTRTNAPRVLYVIIIACNFQRIPINVTMQIHLLMGFPDHTTNASSVHIDSLDGLIL